MPTVETVLGVDIGSTSIKAVSLLKGDDGYAARLLAVEPIRPIEGDESGALSVKLALQSLVQKHSLKGTRCALSLSGPDVAPRFFSFPALNSDQELENAIMFEAREVIPFDLDDALLDWHTFPMDLDAPKSEGIFVAARADAVNGLYELAKMCGLQPVIMDTDALALANAFVEAGGGKPVELATLVLSIGDRTTNLAVLLPTGRCFIRDIPAGGERVTQVIADKLKVSLPSAEELKTGGEPGRPNTAENLARLEPILSDVLEQGLSELCEQVRDSIGFFMSQRFFDTIDEVWVTGGAASLPGVPEYLSDTFAVPTFGWNPLHDISLVAVPEGNDPEAIDALGPMMSIAVGLAMRVDMG
jgi:type IV pilus assembly protein PilM